MRRAPADRPRTGPPTLSAPDEASSSPTRGSTIVRSRVFVSGRVQGVWFRETCRRRADDEGVSGWARNLGDGRVHAEFEGAPAAVQRMVDWCRIGPPRADVTSVHVEEIPPTGEVGFRVR